MILFGASGHAKVIIDLLLKSGHTIDFLVDARQIDEGLMGYEVKSEEALSTHHDHEIIISIGVNKTRRTMNLSDLIC